jgi:hypothetical protein
MASVSTFVMDTPSIELAAPPTTGVNVFAMGTLVYAAPLNPTGTPAVADWCARGKSWMLAQFATKPIIGDLLCAILDEVQEVEQAIADVREVRALSSAFGAQLDEIGVRLGYARDDQTDTQYRLELTAVAQARIDNSSIPAIIRVFTALVGLGTFRQQEDYPAGYRVFADNPIAYASGRRYARIGRLAKPGGVRYDFNYVPQGFQIMSFSDDTVHTPIPFAERGVSSSIRMAERDAGK